MPHHNTSETAPDAILAAGLVSSPAWGPWLTQLNQLLTTATLIVGLTLGVARLWVFWRNRSQKDKDRT